MRGSYLASTIETSILDYLFFVTNSFNKCLEALSFQKESISCENIDRFITQVKQASIIADNAVCYKKTADALVLDIKKEGAPVDSGFFSKIEKCETEIERLKSDYNKEYLILKNKIKDLMNKYNKKLSEFSKISKILKDENKNSFDHLSEMLDVSV